MTWTLSTAGRAACIDGGLNAAIAGGTTQTYPYVKITTSGGATTLLTIDLDATTPLLDNSDGTGTLQRPSAASWSGYQQNAEGTGDMAEFGVYNRDDNLIGSGTVTTVTGAGDWQFADSPGVGVTSGNPVATSAPTITQPAS